LENNSFLGEWVQQRLLGLETIKHCGTEAIEIDRMRGASARLFTEFLRAARLKARTSPMIEWFGICAICAALYISFQDIATGQLPGAVAMSFFSSLALFAQSAAKLGRYFNSNREGLAAADRIFAAIHMMDVNRQERIGHTIAAGDGQRNQIVIQGVSLNYGVTQAVHDFSYTFDGGKIYCLVGASGAGKSSLFSLILGLCQPDSGSIKFGCVSGSESRETLISYLPQAIPEVPCELGEGVAYPRLRYQPARAREALDSVGFQIDASRLPDGLATRVVAYHRSPVILIDEGTSALDPEMEKFVLSRIRKLADEGAVVVMIAHRLAAVEASDEVLVMSQGALVRSGKTSDVLRSGEFLAVFH
jgi:ATP-binding cassette subfamily B protein